MGIVVIKLLGDKLGFINLNIGYGVYCEIN